MKNFSRPAIVLIAAIFAATIQGCQIQPTIPSNIAVQGEPVLRVHAVGDQIYTWQSTTNTWKFKMPEATFSGGGVTGKHYAGPIWEAQDGSKVVGQKLAESPAPDPNAIPWLLLASSSHDGNGVLSQVTFIQRLSTSGGKAPAAPGKTDGEEARVQYTATYVFYGAGAVTQPSGTK